MSITAIVPAYNEEDRVASTVRALLGSGRVDDVIVVDDGSSDRTADRARGAGAGVVRLRRNLGKAAAITGGVAATESDILLFCDADLAESAAAVTALLDPILSGAADMAIAAPPPAGGPSGFGLVESFARWGIARIARRTFDRPLSGQRALRREYWPAGRPAPGFGFEVGLTIDAVRAGARVVEVPCAFTHARTGRDISGFVHRARQGAAVVRAVAARASRPQREAL
jgi:glycosyltransferase involved in cell wall biosynthesis